MKIKALPLMLVSIGIVAAMAIAPIHANYLAVAYSRVDKSTYLPGDSGILYVTVRNEGSQAITVKNVTVDYPWMAFVTDHWDGNFTMTGITQPLSQNQNYNGQFSFIVPTDGRAHSGDVIVLVGTDAPSPSPYQLLQTTAVIQIAGGTYQPFGVITSILPIVSIALIAIAVVMLFLVYMGLGKLSKK